MKQYLWRTLRITLVASLLILVGCEGDDGDRGPEGPQGPSGEQGAPGETVSTGTISGTVTNSLSSEPLEGVTVSGAGSGATTDATGAFTITDVSVGVHDLSFSRANFNSASESVSVTAGDTVTQNLSMAPVSAVVLSVTGGDLSAYGESVELSASLECFDGRTSCGTTWSWSQTEGPAATAAGSENASSETYSFGSMQDYKDHLFDEVLQDSKFAFFGPSRSDRVKVHGINPFSLEQGIEAEFMVTATLDNGDTVSDTVTITGPHLPYDIAPGLRNVPLNRAVVLHGPNSWSSYDWSISTAPAGSAATLNDGATQHPYFTPDVAGTYTLSVTDGTDTETMDIAAGEWEGAISDIGADGKPVGGFCTDCHNGGIAPDKFTSWRESGHAHILTDNLNTSTHYGPGCFMCHTVGYDPDSVNGGIDEAGDFQAWLDSGMFNEPNAENWANTVENYPQSAKLANIQCENCHGPNESDFHGQELAGSSSSPEAEGFPRVSINADVCATCHGEPKRHARFQQWQEAGHSNVGLAIWAGAVDDGSAHQPSATDPGGGHCGRCHTGQGFRAWIKQDVTSLGAGDYIDLSDYLLGANGEVFGVASTIDYQTGLEELGLTQDEVEPQTCTVCHMVHNPGTSSGEPNDVILRLTADDVLNLPAGFEASNLGRGGLCIACHNSRNGAFNDVEFDWSPNNPAQAPNSFMDDSLPHGSAQGDNLMGQNAFFLETGDRSPHSLITDSCATCHMELTPPPAELSYNLSGTNHRFAATLEICSDCHGEFDGGNVQSVFDDRLDELDQLLLSEMLQQIKNYISDAAYPDVRLVDSSGTTLVTMTDASLLTAVGIGGHGNLNVTVTYNGTDYSGNLGHVDNGQLVGLVAFDAGAGADDLMINLPLTSGEYAGQALAKSQWNYAILADDGSGGIHNPDWMTDIFNATEKALKQLP